jgi:hypothetical protein
VIQSTQDLADALFGAVTTKFWIEPDEATFTHPITAAGIVPPQTAFTVETVEGKRFRVTVTEEKGG